MRQNDLEIKTNDGKLTFMFRKDKSIEIEAILEDENGSIVRLFLLDKFDVITLIREWLENI